MPKRLSEKVIFKTKLFTIKDVELEFEHTEKKTFQILEKQDNVIIIPITSDNQLILIREYFTALEEYQLDLPGGRIDPEYDDKTTAKKKRMKNVEDMIVWKLQKHSKGLVTKV